MKDIEDDVINRFLKTWKGMLLFSAIFFGIYGLLVYAGRLRCPEEERIPFFLLGNFLFGAWAPWVMASPFAGLGCLFIYAAFHDKASAVPPENSIREDGQET